MGRKWANIVLKKGKADKLRGAMYSKALFEVTAAVKRGGDDTNSNFLLKIALEKCKKNNVPKDNVDKAIKRGLSNETDDTQEVSYEGYGPKGVGIYIEAATNNVTRTIAFVRACFSRGNGTLETPGALQFIFNRKAVFEVPNSGLDEDEFTLEMIDAGAEDIENEDGYFSVYAEKENFGEISKKLETLGVTPEEAGLEQIPVSYKTIDDETYLANMKLVEALEEGEDILKVYHNIEFQEHFNDL